MLQYFNGDFSVAKYVPDSIVNKEVLVRESEEIMVTPKKKLVKTVSPIPPPKERKLRRTMSQNDMLTFWASYGIFIPSRKIYIGSTTTDVDGNESGVDSAMARSFEIQISTLEYFDDKKPITVTMNNLGGDQYHAMAIYDRIMGSPCQVIMQATGYVMSAGSIILQAADRRLLSRNATVMLHYGTSGSAGHKLDVERWADESKRLRMEMEEIYLGQMVKKDPSMNVEKLRALIQFDLYLDAGKAVKLGLADGIIPWPKHKKARPKQVPPTTETPPEA